VVEVNYNPATSPGDPSRPRMEGYGTAQMCAQCHRARRDNANVAGQIANGSSHFGPHGSPQMDMFVGAGSYELDGYTYERESAHQASVSTACVKCHMVRETELHGETTDHAFHTFSPDPGNCEPCHQGLANFDYKGVQTAIAGKLDQLAVLLGYTDAADMEEKWNSDNGGVEVWKREAGYAFVFVANDGSHGVHNPEYAMSLLDNAIAYAEAQLALVMN
jgi:cytochrome c553